MADAVKSPAHYRAGGVEVIDFIRDQCSSPEFGFVDYCRGNVIKYVARAGLKDDPSQDFAKAAFYAQMAAHTLEPDKYPDPRVT